MLSPAAAAANRAAYEHAPSTLSLPAELWQRCFQTLGLSDLCAASAACREWREVAQREELWKERYMVDFARSEGIVGSRMGSSSLGCSAARLFPHAQPAALQAPSPPAAESMPAAPGAAAAPAWRVGAKQLTEQGGSWREGYKQRMDLESNWREGRCSWQQLRGHRDYIRCAQMQGSSLATCSGSYTQRDCSIRLWDLATGECRERMAGHEGPIWSMHMDGQGGRIASCDDEGCVRLWDLQSHRVGVASTLMPHSLKCLGMDGRQLAVSGESGLVGLWSLAAILQALQDAEEVLESTAPSDDGNDDAHGDGMFPAWQPVALESSAAGVRPALARAPLLMRSGAGADTNCLQLDGGICATGDAAGDVHLWATGGDELRYQRALGGHHKGVSTLSFQHSTGHLVAGSGKGQVRLWDMERGVLLAALLGHSADVLCHQQSGALLATGAADFSVRLWDLRCPGGCTSTVTGSGGGGDSGGGSSGGEAQQAHYLELAQHVIRLDTYPYSLQLDDRRLAIGCADGLVQLVDLRHLGAADVQLRDHTVLPAHKDRVWALALSESRLVTASLDACIVVRSFLPNPPAAAWQAHGRRQADAELDSAFGRSASGMSDADDGGGLAGSDADDSDDGGGGSEVGADEGSNAGDGSEGNSEAGSDSGSDSEDEGECATECEGQR